MRLILNAFADILPDPLYRLGAGLYNSLPRRMRYGKVFYETAQFLDNSQYWSRERHANYQFQMALRVIRHAYENVPFYARLYRAYGVCPDDIKSDQDLKRIPIISKKDLQSNIATIVTRNFPKRKFQYHTTGGSTGQPVGLYWEANRTVPMEHAFMLRQWKWMGYNPDIDRSIVLRGSPIKNGRIWRKSSSKQIYISSYHLTRDNIGQYADVINEFKPAVILAYPSAIFLLAQFMTDAGEVPPSSIRVVLCGSENLYTWQRKMIEKVFNCKVHSWYGQSEYVAMGGECEYSQKYHFYSEYGLTEILLPDGKPAAPGELGEIIATGFNNMAMPLIRYRTEDMAVLSREQNCQCQRNYLLVDKIDGRLQEMIVSRFGNLISMTAVNMHTNVFDEVYQFQFYQKEAGRVILRIIKKDNYSENSESKIIKSLQEKLHNQIDVDIEYVQSIEMTPRGKSRFLVQDLSLGRYWQTDED